MFSWITSKVLGWAVAGMFAILVAGGTAFYFYFNATQSQIVELGRELQTTQIKLATEEATTGKLRIDIEGVKKANGTLLIVERQLRNDLRKAEGRVAKLIAAARENPTEGTKQINKTIEYRLQCMAIATGATISEIDRKDGFVNPVCPQFFREIKP